MTGACSLGLMLGVGLFLVCWSMWVPEPAAPARVTATPGRPAAPRRPRPGRARGARARAVLAGAGRCTFVFLLALACAASRPSRCASRRWPRTRPLASSGCRRAGAAPGCATCGRTSSTTSPRASARGWPCPRRWASSAIRGPEELRPAFAAFARRLPHERPLRESLDRLKERLGDPVGDRLVESLRIAREVGGSDLGILLRTLSMFLREDARTRAELEARQSWTVNAARLAVGAPWVVLALLSLRPESVARLRHAGSALLVLARRRRPHRRRVPASWCGSGGCRSRSECSDDALVSPTGALLGLAAGLGLLLAWRGLPRQPARRHWPTGSRPTCATRRHRRRLLARVAQVPGRSGSCCPSRDGLARGSTGARRRAPPCAGGCSGRACRPTSTSSAPSRCSGVPRAGVAAVVGRRAPGRDRLVSVPSSC